MQCPFATQGHMFLHAVHRQKILAKRHKRWKDTTIICGNKFYKIKHLATEVVDAKKNISSICLLFSAPPCWPDARPLSGLTAIILTDPSSTAIPICRPTNWSCASKINTNWWIKYIWILIKNSTANGQRFIPRKNTETAKTFIFPILTKTFPTKPSLGSTASKTVTKKTDVLCMKTIIVKNSLEDMITTNEQLPSDAATP